ncbi:MAG TPA: hypothetical protein PLU87_15365 [Sedimentisphaerales bacterium]|nr:hypothetical protein [Sedimentisphaerales bacterium]HRS12430.1 hypothetical protein [Sedimentisphaerales bacterium]HRV48928.1 hypothetical protein [Sedimentisphaerales bacterium]
MKRSRNYIAGVLLVSLLVPAALLGQEFFWCGGDITNLLDPNQTEALQTALQQAHRTISWGMFARGMRNEDETPLTGVVRYDPSKAWDGYTLLCTMGGYVDPDTGVNNPAILIQGNRKVML